MQKDTKTEYELKLQAKLPHHLEPDVYSTSGGMFNLVLYRLTPLELEKITNALRATEQPTSEQPFHGSVMADGPT